MTEKQTLVVTGLLVITHLSYIIVMIFQNSKLKDIFIKKTIDQVSLKINSSFEIFQKYSVPLLKKLSMSKKQNTTNKFKKVQILSY